jgi:CelD/BcsL family acetyltransferase involved in cellulose biosynthesis
MDHPRRPAYVRAHTLYAPVPADTDSTPTVERHDAVAPIAAEWDALAARVGAAPFLRPGWIEAWSSAFGAPRLTILAARRGGELAGVLPLERRRGRVLAGTANAHSPLGGALADGPEAARALAGAVLAIPHARADFVYADPSDPVLEELRMRRPSIARVQSEQPYVDTSGDRDAYTAALSRKHRKELGRLRRKLEAAGELGFEFADGSERLDELLEEGFAIEGSGWKSESGTAINSSYAERRFYTEIARWAARSGWLRLAFLRLDGRAIAFDYCLDSGGSFYALKGGYDTEFRRLGPGVVLTHESIARAFADPGLRSYEFLGTADEYKLAWTDATHPRMRVQAFSRSPLGLAQLVAWRHGRPLAKRVLGR